MDTTGTTKLDGIIPSELPPILPQDFGISQVLITSNNGYELAESFRTMKYIDIVSTNYTIYLKDLTEYSVIIYRFYNTLTDATLNINNDLPDNWNRSYNFIIQCFAYGANYCNVNLLGKFDVDPNHSLFSNFNGLTNKEHSYLGVNAIRNIIFNYNYVSAAPFNSLWTVYFSDSGVMVEPTGANQLLQSTGSGQGAYNWTSDIQINNLAVSAGSSNGVRQTGTNNALTFNSSQVQLRSSNTTRISTKTGGVTVSNNIDAVSYNATSLGTVSAPTYCPGTSTTTGIYSNVENEIDLTCNSTQTHNISGSRISHRVLTEFLRSPLYGTTVTSTSTTINFTSTSTPFHILLHPTGVGNINLEFGTATNYFGGQQFYFLVHNISANTGTVRYRASSNVTYHFVPGGAPVTIAANTYHTLLERMHMLLCNVNGNVFYLIQL
jgi:hypothetical protein